MEEEEGREDDADERGRGEGEKRKDNDCYKKEGEIRNTAR